MTLRHHAHAKRHATHHKTAHHKTTHHHTAHHHTAHHHTAHHHAAAHHSAAVRHAVSPRRHTTKVPKAHKPAHTSTATHKFGLDLRP